MARYLLRSYLPAFLLCLGLCVGVLLMNQFLRLFQLAILKGISPLWMLACFARLLPYFCSIAIPIAFLVALLLTLGQLSERGEVLALRSSGFSFPDILWPYLALAVLLSGALLYVNHKASPDGFHAFKNRYEGALNQISRLDLEPGALTSLGEWRLFARDVDRGDRRLGGVYLVKVKGARRGLRVDAPEGRLIVEKGRGIVLELYRGTIKLPAEDPERLLSAGFAEYRLFVPLSERAASRRQADLQELSTPRLREGLRGGELDRAHRMEYLTEEALRSAGALTPFVFFWIGCPLGLNLEKHAKAAGFALSLLVLFVYYGLLVLGIGLGRGSPGLSSWGPWLPVAAGLLAGAYFWRRRLRA